MADSKGAKQPEIKTRKAINFDLDTHKLKGFFGENYQTAYYKVERFFKRHRFEHRQGSGYCSIDKLDALDNLYMTKEMTKEFPWMKDCIKNIDVTDVGKIHSLNYVFESDKKLDQDIKQQTAT